MSGIGDESRMMLRRKQKDAFGNTLASPLDGSTTYHDEGWWEDLSEVRGALILLALAVLSFAGVLLVFFNESHLNGITGSGAGTTSNGTTAIGGLATVLTVIGSIVSALWAIYTASQNRHRVRKLAWTCAGLSAVNLIAFIAFAIVTA